MEEKILFKVKTKMDKEDYRKFLYLATFKKSPIIIPMILFIAAIGAGIIAFENGVFNIVAFLIAWVFMTVLAFGTICFKVEYKNKKRVKTDKIGTFNTYQTLSFYEDYVIVVNDSIEGKGKIRYDQFYGLLESKEYLIFYYDANMASLIRKKDIDDECKSKIIELLQEKLGDTFKTI
ncbi:hypothetical protein DP129_11220 [Clostridium tetani]|uniref:YcxB family protein n=1 Tax=Clostridium tetani TaxID=1513 RepID=UPI00100C2801|nr:YcxB family protein [Clostridium tetani]RXI38781.1 hypothetical protein DP129_11220 [Clostridium tetani]